MRPMFPGDLDHAVRVLLAAPPQDWAMISRVLLDAAKTADVYRKRLGRAHPRYGTGSVLSATAGWPKVALPTTCDRLYCAALAAFLAAYLDHKTL